MDDPRMSPGMTSGVIWTLPNGNPSPWARSLTTVVLASPGKPSSKTCPPQAKPVSRFWIRPGWPKTRASIWSARSWKRSRIAFVSAEFSGDSFDFRFMGWQCFLVRKRRSIVVFFAIHQLTQNRSGCVCRIFVHLFFRFSAGC